MLLRRSVVAVRAIHGGLRGFAAARPVLVYGANTDVGKTVASAGLCLAALGRGLAVRYVKPVQTGLESDAAAVLQHCGQSAGQRFGAETLFHYASPESPATAARKEGGGASDAAVRAALGAALERADGGAAHCVVETAGGPLSPAPSGVAQADVYAPLRLPCVVVGDAKLGGISATLCALESLAARRQRPAAVLFIGGEGPDGNAEAVRGALATSPCQAPVITVPRPPELPEPLGAWLEDPKVVAGFAAVLEAVEVQGSTTASRSVEEYVAFDRQHLWHPYTSMVRPGRVWPVRGAAGAELELEDGRRLVDGMSSWWCAVHGYNVPELNAAAAGQLSAASHVMFGGLTHRPAAELAELLVGCAPEGLCRAFLCDSGSVSVEVALKMALQYWAMRGRPEKCRIATVRRGYHGDTFGAMAVCDPERGMHTLFRGVLPQHLFADPPAMVREGAHEDAGDGFESMEALLREHADEVAAVILEPIVQGAGGMRIYAPSYLQKLRALCDELGVLLIFDEIATGFGRTGRLFACQHAGVSPDVLCVGKALSGGYCTLGATLATDEVARGVSGEGSQPLMHGPTFMANPLACAIAAASVRLLLASPWQERVLAIERQFKKELAPLIGAPGVADVRALGAIGVVELRAPPRQPAALQEAFVERGVWLRPFANLIYSMPPFIITEEELRRITSAIVHVVGAGLELEEG